MDSDIHKTLEAIGWELAHGARPELGSFAAQVTALLEEAQCPDGYLDSYFQVSHASHRFPEPLPRHGKRRHAIPYFQWDNRGGGPMRVWMPRADG